MPLTAKWSPSPKGLPGRIDFISATTGNLNLDEDDRGLRRIYIGIPLLPQSVQCADEMTAANNSLFVKLLSQSDTGPC